MPKNTETGLPLEQLSIFDFLEEKPVHRYRATFKNLYGIVMHVFFEVNEKKDIRETLQKYRQEHKDLFFPFIEEI